MFLIIGTYIKPIEEVDRELANHYDFLDKYLAAKKIILAGRRVPRFGGVILCNAGKRSDVEAILSEDPFYREGIMEYQIVEFTPVKYAEGMERLWD